MKKSYLISGLLITSLVFSPITALAETVTAKLSQQKVEINGQTVQVTAYNINGRNYLQLREIAAKTDTFNVSYDAATNAVLIDTKTAYSQGGNPANETFAPSNPSETVNVQPTSQQVKINSVVIPVEAYNIDGRNYMQLRDIANKLNLFAVDYDAGTNAVLIDTTKPYIDFDTGQVTTLTKKSELKAEVLTGTLLTDMPETPPLILQNEVEPPEFVEIPVVSVPVSVMTKAGDIIETEDGEYVITVGKIETIEDTKDGAYPYKGEPELPQWQDEWSYIYKPLSQPEWTVKRVQGKIDDKAIDTLYVFNAYETERMIRAIYQYAPQNIDLWEDDNPNTKIPNYSISIKKDKDMENNMFFPYRDSEVSKQVLATGGGKIFRIFAVDQYVNGIFQDTIYYMK